jgi:predicted transcriptional regulator
MLDRKPEPKKRTKSDGTSERMLSSSKAKSIRSFLNVNPEQQFEVVRGLASPVRVRILKLLRRRGPLNINQISEALGMPQSTIATNIQILEESDLIDTEIGRARKGQQKICAARFDEIVIRLDGEETSREKDIIEVEMPLGLYTSYNVSAPCGLCSTEGIMGVLDVPDLFLDPCRVQAALIWFGRGYVEYKFPNNAKVLGVPVTALEFALELSSEVPGTNANWPSDISLWVNDVKVGTWTSPGDYGDRRGVHTPQVVEARGFAVRRSHAVAHLVEGHLYGCEKAFIGDAGPAAISRTSLDSFADRYRRQRRASRRCQYFRPGLWQS